MIKVRRMNKTVRILFILSLPLTILLFLESFIIKGMFSKK